MSRRWFWLVTTAAILASIISIDAWLGTGSSTVVDADAQTGAIRVRTTRLHGLHQTTIVHPNDFWVWAMTDVDDFQPRWQALNTSWGGPLGMRGAAMHGYSTSPPISEFQQESINLWFSTLSNDQRHKTIEVLGGEDQTAIQDVIEELQQSARRARIGPKLDK